MRRVSIKNGEDGERGQVAQEGRRRERKDLEGWNPFSGGRWLIMEVTARARAFGKPAGARGDGREERRKRWETGDLRI